MLPYHTRITKYLFIIFLILIFAYAFFEARNIFLGPIIKISTPEAGITVQSQAVEITGAIKNVTTITLDGRALLINEAGEFTEKLLLSPGVNIFEFVAQDKFGREKRKKIEVFYKKNNKI